MIKALCRPTRQATRYIYFYNVSNLYDLSDCYKHYSSAKKIAFDQIKAQCNALRGRSLKIIFANLMTFTTGYLYDTDEGTFLRVNTPTRVYEYNVEED